MTILGLGTLYDYAKLMRFRGLEKDSTQRSELVVNSSAFLSLSYGFKFLNRSPARDCTPSAIPRLYFLGSVKVYVKGY